MAKEKRLSDTERARIRTEVDAALAQEIGPVRVRSYYRDKDGHLVDREEEFFPPSESQKEG